MALEWCPKYPVALGRKVVPAPALAGGSGGWTAVLITWLLKCKTPSACSSSLLDRQHNKDKIHALFSWLTCVESCLKACGLKSLGIEAGKANILVCFLLSFFSPGPPPLGCACWCLVYTGPLGDQVSPELCVRHRKQHRCACRSCHSVILKIKVANRP